MGEVSSKSGRISTDDDEHGYNMAFTYLKDIVVESGVEKKTISALRMKFRQKCYHRRKDSCFVNITIPCRHHHWNLKHRVTSSMGLTKYLTGS